MAQDICSVVENDQRCSTVVYAREMCERHYARWRRHGDPLLGSRKPSTRTCSVVERQTRCHAPHYARGMCEKHYKRWKTAGDPLIVKCPKGVPVADRFWAKVDKDGPVPVHRPDLGPCWVWTAGRFDSGYGAFGIGGGKLLRAHRYAYEQVVGPIPAGLVLDHLCRNHPCVNPAHLEPVTDQENLLRGTGAPARNARKTHCKHGHEFTPENTHLDKDGYRACRACWAIRAVAKRERAVRPPDLPQLS